MAGLLNKAALDSERVNGALALARRQSYGFLRYASVGMIALKSSDLIIPRAVIFNRRDSLAAFAAHNAIKHYDEDGPAAAVAAYTMFVSDSPGVLDSVFDATSELVMQTAALGHRDDLMVMMHNPWQYITA